MSTYFTDFSEYSTGVQPPDWTADFNAGSVTWSVESDAGAIGGQLLRGVTDASETERLLSWDDIEDGGHDDVEIVAKFRVPSSGDVSLEHGVALRATGSSGNETTYYVDIEPGNDQAVIREFSGGSYVADHASAPETMAGGDWVWLRFRVNGSNLKVKLWADGDPEPGSWEGTATDASITGTGNAGIWIFAGNMTVDVDVVGVGTGGDAAPASATSGPDKPTCFEESHNDTDVALSGSPYSGPNPHAESRWQVANQGVAYSTSTTHDSGWTASDLESHVATDTLPPGNPQKARVKYRDDQGNESPWSDDVLFTTAPPRPTGLSVSPQ